VAPKERAMRFADLVNPLSPQDFLTRFRGRQWLKQAVRANVTSLVTWSDVDRVLETTRIGDRMRLVKQGRRIDRTEYVMIPDVPDRSLARSDRLTSLLRQGASLVVDGVEELLTNVRGLADSCERSLDMLCHVNLYAGWGEREGFPLHWDDHDTLILQIVGRKHWQVFQPTRLHPFRQDTEDAPQPGPEHLVWDGLLNQGEMLYMPRGWWHVAKPIAEPTLHLTLGLTAPTGARFLTWLAQEMKRFEEVRADLPTISEEWVPQYIEMVRRKLDEVVTPEAMRGFLGWWAAQGAPRPRFDLARLSAAPDMSLSSGAYIRLSAGRRVIFDGVDATGRRAFSIGDPTKKWACSPEYVTVLSRLSPFEPVRVGSLCDELDETQRRKFKLLLAALR
jgi:ribosomal protein L16 Arg81 hydroxylase